MTMKKMFLLMAGAIAMPMSTLKADPLLLDLQVRYEDPSIGKPIPKSPIQPPHVGIEDYTLYLYTPCDGCEVRIVNADMEVEYSTIIPNGTNSLDLPTELSGEYELEIIQGGICFYTYIEL